MMINLYPDQADTVERLKAAMYRNKSVLLQSPTGSGKTAMAIHMLASAREKGKRVIFTVPRRELMKQTSLSFDSYGLDHSYIAAGKPFNPYAKLHVGMIDTMARRLSMLPDADLVIIDEAHFGMGALDIVIHHYKKKGSWVIGLSATPWKSSGKGLGCWYDTMVEGQTMRWLIDNKRLSDYRYFIGKNKPDLSGVSITAGDYAKGQLADLMENERVIIGDCVNDYITRAMGRLHIVRCASIKHSQIIAQSFRDAGLPAQHVDGTTKDGDMRRIIRAYARREILVLTFCDLLNFGFDLSQASGMDVCIESCSDLKPSKSLAGQMQFWGRVLRMKDKPAIINDHVNNFQEHYFPATEREWTLSDRKQGKKKNSEPVPPTRQCPDCFLVHTPMNSCPECGHVYEIKSREIDEVDGDLEEIDENEFERVEQERKKTARADQGKAKSLNDLISLGKRRGMKHPAKWAAHVLSARMAKEMRK